MIRLTALTLSLVVLAQVDKLSVASEYEPACFGLFSNNTLNFGGNVGGYGYGGYPAFYGGGGYFGGGLLSGYGNGYFGAQFSGYAPQRSIIYFIQSPQQFGGWGSGYGGYQPFEYQREREFIRQSGGQQFFTQPYPQFSQGGYPALYGGSGGFPAIQGYGGGFGAYPAVSGFSGGFSGGGCPGGICMPFYQATTPTASPQTPSAQSPVPTKTLPVPKTPEKSPASAPPAAPPAPQSAEVVPSSRIEGMGYVYPAPSQPRSVDSSYFRQCVRIDTRGPSISGHASGAIVGTSRTKCYILTCKHFLKGNILSITVHADGQSQDYPARVVSVSPGFDLSLLVTQRPPGVHSLTFSQSKLGTLANMFGANRSGKVAWRSGLRSATNIKGYDSYDLFADLGDSGAALFDQAGHVLGVVSMSETSRTNCLAVPVNQIQTFLLNTPCAGLVRR
jgi:S1-C subfamily serine protease